MNSRLPQITEPTGADEPLGEADVERIAAPGELPDIHTEGDGGVEDPGAVEVQQKMMPFRERDDGGGIFGCQRGPVTAVMGVFQTDEAGPGEVDVLGADGGLDILQRECPIGLVGDRVGEDSSQGGHPARFVEKNVGAVAQDHLFAARTVGQHTGDISHRAAYDQKGRLLSQPLGGHRLEAVDRGVLAEDVIAQRGVMHGLPHGLGGKGYGIAAQIDESHRQPPVVTRVVQSGRESTRYQSISHSPGR